MDWDAAERVSFEYTIKRLEERGINAKDEAERIIARDELREKKLRYERLYRR